MLLAVAIVDAFVAGYQFVRSNYFATGVLDWLLGGLGVEWGCCLRNVLRSCCGCWTYLYLL